MLFNSIDFLIFFPIVLLIYYVIPKKIRYIWLLISSYYFYMCWNAKYALLILTSTIVTYISGLLIQKFRKKKKSKNRKTKIVVALSFFINLGILFFFKYYNFSATILAAMFGKIHIQPNIPLFDIMLPVGISFYTFQALSYTMDVYRGEIKAEKNILRYALFVSFFPQLVAGPIERSKNLLSQLSNPEKPSFYGIRDGILLMIWGYFLKIVLADRIAIFVDTVYSNSDNYAGYYIVIATILFAFQIYCDFAGYSIIAMGTARILGIRLVDNFNAPYFAGNVSEFWRRWHISLTSWFKDYLYIPLGGNKKGIVRKYINIMIVFLVSGLWHGASTAYIIWGGLNGLYQVIGSLLKPVRDKMVKILKLNRESIGHKLLKVFVTFILVDFSWIFFRAGKLSESIHIIKQMITVNNPWVIFDDSLYNCGLDIKNFGVMLMGLLILLFADYCKYKNITIRKIILKQDYWVRWIVFAGSIILILLFGKWGPSFDQANFIYFQF